MSNLISPVLDNRLLACASFVRKNSVICDVGTDHAYIPIYLVLNNQCKYAIATDINDGPLKSAEENAIKFGVSDKIKLIKANGLQFDNIKEYGITDILICGMGGELIADIIDRCEYTRSENVTLILQPMSVPGALRQYLWNNGYEEISGTVSFVSKKVYQTLVVKYTGKNTEYSEAELLVGKCRDLRLSPLYGNLIDKFIQKLSVERDGKKLGKIDTSYEDNLLNSLEEIKRDI